jgi:hypothetical protein
VAARFFGCLYDWLWPGAGARFVEFIATLLTTNLHLQRLPWSRQFGKS